MFDWIKMTLALLGSVPGAGEVRTQVLLEATQSWDGALYGHYPAGQPQATLLRIEVPADTCLGWHEHSAVNVAYIEEGSLRLERRDTGQSLELHPGDAVAEMVNTVHRGCTGPTPVKLLVFYAGAEGLPLSTPAQDIP